MRILPRMTYGVKVVLNGLFVVPVDLRGVDCPRHSSVHSLVLARLANVNVEHVRAVHVVAPSLVDKGAFANRLGNVSRAFRPAQSEVVVQNLAAVAQLVRVARGAECAATTKVWRLVLTRCFGAD